MPSLFLHFYLTWELGAGAYVFYEFGWCREVFSGMTCTSLQCKKKSTDSNLFGYLPRTSDSSQITRCHQHGPVEVTSKLIFSCLLCFSQLKKFECRTVLFSWKAETWELLCDLHLSIWILLTEHTQRIWSSSLQCKVRQSVNILKR